MTDERDDAKNNLFGIESPPGVAKNNLGVRKIIYGGTPGEILAGMADLMAGRPSPVFLMVTQNPLEQEGAYSLTEAQLDRFQMKPFLDEPKNG